MASKIKTRLAPVRRFALAGLASVACLGLAGEAHAADHSFKPVNKTKRKLVFNPGGIVPAAVGDTDVRVRLGRQRLNLDVRPARVASALATDSKLKVRRPKTSRGGVLEVDVLDVPEEPPVDLPEEPPVDLPEEPVVDGCTFGSFSSQNRPGACWRPYSDESPFNRTLGASPRTLSSSSQTVSKLNSWGKGQPIIGGVADTADDWDHTLYYSKPTDPVYTIDCVEEWGTCEIEGMKVRIPNAARPAAGGDGSMGVIDQATGWEYDFWQVRSKPSGGGTIKISWGGRTEIGTPDSDGLDSNGTAAHFGTAAGIIRPEELEAGEINHALFLMVKCTNNTFVAPAQGPGVGRTCAEMGLSNQNAPAMGQHFYLDMTEAEINRLNVPEWRKTILRAMATYGAFVGDTGGNTWRLKIESGTSVTSFGGQDPWTRLGRKFNVPSWQENGKEMFHFDTAAGVDWSRLKVADPCVAQGTC